MRLSVIIFNTSKQTRFDRNPFKLVSHCSVLKKLKLLLDELFDYFNIKVQDFTQRIVYLSKNCCFFQVTNEFGVPVAVHNLSLAFEATRYFNLITDGVNGGSGFEPVILQPGETKDLSFLSLKDEAWEDRILNSILTIHTNISNIHVPLLCFHGLIDTVSIIQM